MKTIEKDELYRTISEFMKAKGLELTEGPYAGHIRRGCDLLSDAINVAQRTVVRAKEEMDKKLLRLRQCIHEATAPPQPETPPSPAPATTPTVTPEPQKPDVAQATTGRRPKKSPKRREPASTARRRPKAAAEPRQARGSA
jgi:hypothetical protein